MSGCRGKRGCRGSVEVVYLGTSLCWDCWERIAKE